MRFTIVSASWFSILGLVAIAATGCAPSSAGGLSRVASTPPYGRLATIVGPVGGPEALERDFATVGGRPSAPTVESLPVPAHKGHAARVSP